MSHPVARMFRTHDSPELLSHYRKCLTRRLLANHLKEIMEDQTMCICNYSLSEIDNEEMSIHDVIQSTVDDFNRTIDLLKKHRKNKVYLRHLNDLIISMHRDDCFFFMEPDLDTFITISLCSIHMTINDLFAALSE